MKKLVPKKIPRRVLAVALAVAWLPRIAVPCTCNQTTHSGCGGVATAARGPAGGEHAHGHQATTPAPSHHHQGKTPVRPQCCCGLATACGIKATAGPAPLDTNHYAVAVPVTARVVQSRPVLARWRLASPVAHGPPVYLRNVTLLI